VLSAAKRFDSSLAQSKEEAEVEENHPHFVTFISLDIIRSRHVAVVPFVTSLLCHHVHEAT